MLPNGIVLLVAERPGVPIVAVRAFMRAGSVFEPPDRAGLANLTGSLLTRGTAKRSGPELDAAIEFVGGSLEAGAGRDGLTASLAVLKRDLGLGLDLLSEVVLSPAFPEAEAKRKVAQIQAAIKRSEEDPNTVAARALSRLVFPGHPMAGPSRAPSSRSASSPGTTSSRSIAATCGPTPPSWPSLVTSPWTRRAARCWRAWAVGRAGAAAPARPARGRAVSPRTETIPKELTQATIMLGRPAIRQLDPDYFPLAVASYVLGGGSASRLYARVRDEGGLAYAVYAYVSPGRYGASFAVSAQTRTAEVPKVLDIVREELVRMARDPVTDAELGLAGTTWSEAFRCGSTPRPRSLTSSWPSRSRASASTTRSLQGRRRRVTAADVQRVSARFFGPDAFSRVVVGATK